MGVPRRPSAGSRPVRISLLGSRQWLASAARSALRGRLTHRARRRWRRAVERVRQPLERLRRPVLSVIIPVYNVEQYLADCLESVLDQDFGRFVVIAVDDGSTDGSPAILSAYAARDRRIEVIRQPRAGQGPARNLGVSRARTPHVMFVDADDLVPPGSFRYLVSALERSGSDFAVAGVRRIADSGTYRPSWMASVHDRDRIGICIDDFPWAMADVVAANRILRRDFWVDQVGGFPSGIYEDHVPMVAAYLRGRRFDLLSRVTYEWRLRPDGTSTGQQKHTLANLEARIAVKANARKLVWREATPAVRAAWLGRVLDIDFPPYVEQALTADETYRRTLSDALAIYVDLASPDVLQYVRVRQKIRTYLAAQGAWTALAAADRVFSEQGSIPPTDIRDGSVVLAESPALGTGVRLPDELLELGRSECRLQVCLAECDAVGATRLQLTGWAVIRAIDVSFRMPSIRLALVDEAASRRIELPVHRMSLAEATEWVNWPHGSFDHAGFRTEIDIAALVSRPRRSAAWRLRAEVEVDGVVRQDGVHHAVAGSSASRAALEHRQIRLRGVVATPGFDPEHGFTISVH